MDLFHLHALSNGGSKQQVRDQLKIWQRGANGGADIYGA